MKIVKISSTLRSLGIKIPEIPLKEDLVRFLVESKSERIVEIPVVLNNIPQKKSVILDVGCRYSLLSIQLASLGHKVYGLDINDYRYRHPNFEFTKGDILKPPYKKNFFDTVICLSTVEHIGLGVYGDDPATNRDESKADQEAAKSIHSLLKKDGEFLLTVPFGKPVTSSFQRVYDLDRLSLLLKNFKIRKLQTYILKNGYWLPSEPKVAEKVDSSEVSHALAFVSATKWKN